MEVAGKAGPGCCFWREGKRKRAMTLVHSDQSPGTSKDIHRRSANPLLALFSLLRVLNVCFSHDRASRTFPTSPRHVPHILWSSACTLQHLVPQPTPAIRQPILQLPTILISEPASATLAAPQHVESQPYGHPNRHPIARREYHSAAAPASPEALCAFRNVALKS